MTVGRVHSIETMGTVDGPGIRYVLFMQGCPLRCIFCHNRDSWDPKSGKETTVDEVLQDIKSYLPFMKFSNGGVTATGGEPLLQPQFLTELFSRVKQLGLNTALDTSGFADLNNIKKLLDETDLVILSIKHTDKEKHIQISGAPNERVELFLNYLDSIDKPVWIRYVIIPKLTDSKEDIDNLIKYLKPYKNIKKVEILPYHTMGVYKWENLNQEYALKGVKSPSKESIRRIKNKFSKNGFNVSEE